MQCIAIHWQEDTTVEGQLQGCYILWPHDGDKGQGHSWIKDTVKVTMLEVGVRDLMNLLSK